MNESIRKGLQQYIGECNNELTVAAIKNHIIVITGNLIPKPEWDIKIDPKNQSSVIITPMNDAAVNFLNRSKEWL